MTERREAAKAVREALQKYQTDDPEARESARTIIRNVGDPAIPHLRRALRSPGAEQMPAGRALADLGSEGAFEVLAKAFSEETDYSKRIAALYVGIFIERNGWTPEKARSFPGLAHNVRTYLETDPSHLSIRLCVSLNLQEAVPLLQELLGHEDDFIREQAERAINEIRQ